MTGGQQPGLFDVGDVVGPLPAMIVCEADSCGGHRKCTTEAEVSEFCVRHLALHGGTVNIGCWPQRPDSLASILGPGDTVAWPRGPYNPKGNPSDPEPT